VSLELGQAGAELLAIFATLARNVLCRVVGGLPRCFTARGNVNWVVTNGTAAGTCHTTIKLKYY